MRNTNTDRRTADQAIAELGTARFQLRGSMSRSLRTRIAARAARLEAELLGHGLSADQVRSIR